MYFLGFLFMYRCFDVYNLANISNIFNSAFNTNMSFTYVYLWDFTSLSLLHIPFNVVISNLLPFIQLISIYSIALFCFIVMTTVMYIKYIKDLYNN